MIILFGGSRAATAKMREYAKCCVHRAKDGGHTVIVGDFIELFECE